MKKKNFLIILSLILSIGTPPVKAGRPGEVFRPEEEPSPSNNTNITIRHAPLQVKGGRCYYNFPSLQSGFESSRVSHLKSSDGQAVVYELQSSRRMSLLMPIPPSRFSTISRALTGAALGCLGTWTMPWGTMATGAAIGALGAATLAPLYRLAERSICTCRRPEGLLVPSKDRRSRVPNYEEFPWRVHGHLEADFIDPRTHQSVSIIGSGTLVGPDKVMTAAHCLYYHPDKDYPKGCGPAQAVSFFPGKSNNSTPWGATARKLIIHPRFIECRTEQEKCDTDIGMVVLDSPLGTQLGHFGFEKDADRQRHSKVRITGYPGVPGWGQEMYTMEGPVMEYGERRIRYQIDTSEGQSGSGVCTDTHHCVAVHTLGESRCLRQCNSGTLISPYKTLIDAWLQED